MHPDDRSQKALRDYRLMVKLQYAAPGVLLALALLLPRLADLGANAPLITGLLVVFAVLDFLLFRFLILPQMRRQLQHSQNGESDD